MHIYIGVHRSNCRKRLNERERETLDNPLGWIEYFDKLCVIRTSHQASVVMELTDLVVGYTVISTNGRRTN